MTAGQLNVNLEILLSGNHDEVFATNVKFHEMETMFSVQEDSREEPVSSMETIMKTKLS